MMGCRHNNGVWVQQWGAGTEHGQMVTGVDCKCKQQLMMTPMLAMVLMMMTEDQGDVLFCFF
jgi:hypothetical protein